MVDAGKYLDLLGAPYRIGGRGPLEYDCYGLLAEMYWRVHAVRIPDFRSPQGFDQMHDLIALNTPTWKEVEKHPGCAALIRIGRYVTHCGMILDQNKMIHCWEKSRGVVVERLDQWNHRIVGFYRYE